MLITALSLSSCSKKGGSGPSTPPVPTPTSGSKGYIRLTFSGKTLEARDTIIGGVLSPSMNLVAKLISNPNPYVPRKFTKIVLLSSEFAPNGNLKILASGSIDSSMTNNPLDTYKKTYGDYKLTYMTTSTDYTIDSSSTITVTQANDSFCSGTLDFKLLGGGSKIPAIGSFKIYSK